MERSIGWIRMHRSTPDYDARAISSEAVIHVALIHNLTKRMTGVTTPTRREPTKARAVIRPQQMPSKEWCMSESCASAVVIRPTNCWPPSCPFGAARGARGALSPPRLT